MIRRLRGARAYSAAHLDRTWAMAERDVSERDTSMMNRAGRREAERRARRSRKVGAAVTAGTAVLGGTAAFVGTVAPAGALTSYVVTNNDDSGAGSLRQAMIDAESDGDDSEITFAANVTGTIPVSTQLEIDGDAGDLTIIGPGSGVLSLVGDGNNRIFYMDGSWDGDVASISGLTITGGDTPAGSGAGIKFYDCGDCDLILDDVVISDNTAFDSGGGIQMYGAGDLTITNSVISGNSAGDAGGINFYESGDLLISSTTVSGNTSGNWGGGLYFYNGTSLTILASTFSENDALGGGGGAMWVGGENAGYPASVLIANSTFTGNTATEVGGGLALYGGSDSVEILQSTISGNDSAIDVGDGLYLGDQVAAASVQGSGRGGGEKPATKEDGTARDTQEPRSGGVGPQELANPVTITGSIISANDGTDIGTQEIAVEVASTNNLIGTVTDGIELTSVETIMSSEPGLAPLASNGGPTQTMALLATSAALNAGPVPVPPFPGNDTDQRGPGFARVSDGRVDIGAYEVQVPIQPVPIILEPTFTG